MSPSLILILFIISKTLTLACSFQSQYVSDSTCTFYYSCSNTFSSSVVFSSCDFQTTQFFGSFSSTSYNKNTCLDQCCSNNQCRFDFNNYACNACIQNSSTSQSPTTTDNTQVIVGVVITGIVGVLFICCCYYRCCCPRGQGRRRQSQNEQPNYSQNSAPITSKNMLNEITIEEDEPYSNENCPICLQNNTLLLLSCGHYLHPGCYSNWKLKNATCPVCRKGDRGKYRLLCQKCKKRSRPLSSIQLLKYQSDNFTCSQCKAR